MLSDLPEAAPRTNSSKNWGSCSIQMAPEPELLELKALPPTALTRW